MPTSEVAAIRQRVVEEYLAAKQGLEGYALASRHDFIEARTARIGHYHEQLQVLVGEPQAIAIIAEVLGDIQTA